MMYEKHKLIKSGKIARIKLHLSITQNTLVKNYNYFYTILIECKAFREIIIMSKYSTDWVCVTRRRNVVANEIGESKLAED